MGKGGGCVPSKKRFAGTTAAANEAAGTTSDPLTAISKPVEKEEDESHRPSSSSSSSSSSAAAAAAKVRTQIRIFIVFYSMYGHVERLARQIKIGVDGVDGVEGVLYRVPETLPPEVLGHMNVPTTDEAGGDEIPVMSTVSDLSLADGFLFGFPTRYGSMAAQMKAFFDSTDQLWEEQKLAGKPAGFFVSTGTQGGGQETTAWTAITQLAHHGMIFVPVGYTFAAGMFNMDSIRGGSPYGAGLFAGDGSREPNETELAFAEHQGKYMAGVVKKLMCPGLFGPVQFMPLYRMVSLILYDWSIGYIIYFFFTLSHIVLIIVGNAL